MLFLLQLNNLINFFYIYTSSKNMTFSHLFLGILENVLAVTYVTIEPLFCFFFVSNHVFIHPSD